MTDKAIILPRENRKNKAERQAYALTNGRTDRQGLLQRSEDAKLLFYYTLQSALSNSSICKHQYLKFDKKHYGTTDQPTDRRTRPLVEMRTHLKRSTAHISVLTNKIFLQQRAHVSLSLLKPLRRRPFTNVNFINDGMRINLVDIIGDNDDDDGDKKQSP